MITLNQSQFRRAIPFLACSVFGTAAAMWFALTGGLSHDEHQHLAAGCMILREGLMPYRDFPCFHTPYLPYLYAALFQLPVGLLMIARLAGAVAGGLTVGLVGAWVHRSFRSHPPLVAALATLVSVVLVAFSHVWMLTMGRAWNQEVSTLFALLALIVGALAGKRPQQARLWFLSGLLFALAVGFRITHAPLGGALTLCAILWHRDAPARFRALLWLACGAAVGLAPLAWLFLQAPEQAWFGMLGYAGVNLHYLDAIGKGHNVEIDYKFHRFRTLVASGEFAIGVLLCTTVAAAALWRSRLRGVFASRSLVMLLLAFPFVLIGAVAPSPLVVHYFYPVVIFTILSAMVLIGKLSEGRRISNFFGIAAAACLLLAVIHGLPFYIEDSGRIDRVSQWYPNRFRRQSAELNNHLPPGSTIFTLAPGWALEAGHSIDPRLATGAFAWRVASALDPQRADRLLLPSPRMLEELPPTTAIHLGFEDDLEGDILDYAKTRGYSEHPKIAKGNLWTTPP